MSMEKTLSIIKPDAVARNLIGSIDTFRIVLDNEVIIVERYIPLRLIRAGTESGTYRSDQQTCGDISL